MYFKKLGLCILGVLGLQPVSGYGGAVLTIVPQYTQNIVISTADTLDVTYTVTNTTAKSSLNQLTVDATYQVEESVPAEVTLQNNSCAGVSLAPGRSCTFTVRVYSAKVNKVTLQPRVCAYNGLVCSTPVANHRLSIVVAEPLFINVGINEDGAFPAPLVTLSLRGGQAWTRAATPDSVGVLEGATVSLALAVAVGTGPDGALIEESLDGGKTWSIQPVSGVSLASNLSGATHAGELFLSFGYDGLTPLLLQRDSKLGWKAVDLFGSVGFDGEFLGGSCTLSSGTDEFCAVAGEGGVLAPPFTRLPLLYQTLDGGVSWKSVTPTPDFPENGLLQSVSCMDTSEVAICVAVGGFFVGGNPPLLVQTTNGGQDWQVVSMSGITTYGRLRTVSCTGELSESICVAVGEDSSNFDPLIVQSINRGPWERVNIPNLPNNGAFSPVTCSGSGARAVCAAGGSINTNQGFEPLLAFTSDGGASWKLIQLPDLTLGSVNAVTCVGNYPTAICNAIGIDAQTQGLLQYQTVDAGVTWTNIIDSLPRAIFPATLFKLAYPTKGSFRGGAVRGGRDAVIVA